MTAIVVATGNAGTKYYYGPFTDGEQAAFWARNNLKGFEWHWDDLIRPGSTCLTTSTDDIAFLIAATTRERDCYVTVDDVNWVVPASRSEMEEHDITQMTQQ